MALGVPNGDQRSSSARAVTCQRCQGEGYEFRFTELTRRCPECNLPSPASLERIKQGIEDMEAGRMRPLRDIIAERDQDGGQQ